MRVFFAVNLPDAVRERIDAAVAPLKAETMLPVRWIPSESWHITLNFMGEVSDEQCNALQESAADVASRHRPFEFRIHGAGVFPNKRDPAVWWVGLTSHSIVNLQADLTVAFSRIGFEAEKRSFTPHVTIGRTRRPGAARNQVSTGSALLDNVRLDETVHAESFDLMRSEFSPHGARYSQLAVFQLNREA